ncbi:MAG: hypothetical protein ACR5LD_09245 [Symbiopectobacterium sp.]
MLLGNLLESRAKTKTCTTIEGLLNLQPPIAHVEVDNEIKDCDVASLHSDDIFVVPPGREYSC